MQAQISDASGSSNVAVVTFRITNDDGTPPAAPVALDLWLSDSAAGQGLTSTSASGAVAATTYTGQVVATEGQVSYYQEGLVKTAAAWGGDIQLGAFSFAPSGKIGQGWLNVASGGYSTSYHYAQGGPAGNNGALWTLSSLPVGSVTPYATWPTTLAGRATNAGYYLFDGYTLIGSGAVSVDQTASPSGVTINATAFTSLGAVTLKSGVLRILLTDAANGIVTADACAVQWTGGGADLGDMTTKKAKRVLCDPYGIYTLSITDSGKTLFYPCCSVPGSGKVVAGARLRTASYG